MSRSLSMPGGSDLGASNQLANYQKVLDSFGFGTIVVRQDGRIHLVSNRVAQELGYEVKLLSKKRIFEINPHLSRDKWQTNWQALLDSKHLELETEFINASEMLFPVKLRLSLLENDDEQLCLMSVKNMLHANRYKKLLRLTTKVSRVGGWEWDLTTDRILLTDELYTLLRIPNQHRTKQGWKALLKERLSDREQLVLKEHLEHAIKSGTPCRFTLKFRRSKEKHSRISVSIVPEQSEFQTIKLYGAIQDISVLKPVKDDLEVFRYAFDHSEQLILWESKGQLIYGNQKALKTLGYTNEELRASAVTDIVFNGTAEVWKAKQEQLQLTKATAWQGVLKAKNGLPIPVKGKMNLIRYEGDEINCIYAEKASQNGALSKKLQSLNQVLDHSSDLIFFIGKNGEINWANPAAYQKLGYKSFSNWDDLFLSAPKLSAENIWKASQLGNFTVSGAKMHCLDGRKLRVEVQIIEDTDQLYAVIRESSPDHSQSQNGQNASNGVMDEHLDPPFKPFEEMQREYIIDALRYCNWRISGPKGAAKLLALNSRTLASKMRRLGIYRKDFIE